jgi:hypothetical protein
LSFDLAPLPEGVKLATPGAEVRGLLADEQAGCNDSMSVPPVEAFSPWDDETFVGPTIEIEPRREILLAPRTDPRDGEIDARAREAVFTLREVPEGSKLGSLEVVDVARTAFRADAAGRYELEMRLLDEDGRLSCATSPLSIDAIPEAELYAELLWESPSDPIVEDAGVGHGVDMDLHVLRSLSEGARLEWGDPASDCFVRGATDAKTCLGGEGRVVSDSLSGHLPESFAFEVAEGASLTFGAELHRRYSYESGATARFRLWRNGRLLLESALLERQITTRGALWHIGTYDTQTDTFTIADWLKSN